MERLKELEKFLIKQKYPQNAIQTGTQKAMQRNCETLRPVKENVQKDIIPFVSTFNPKKREGFNVINQNLPILREDRQLKELYSKCKFLKSTFFFHLTGHVANLLIILMVHNGL